MQSILPSACLVSIKSTTMKTLTFIFLMLFSVSGVFAQQNFHDFVVKDIDGKDFPLSSLKGKKVMVVNTASKCGLTPQYEKLEALYKTYGDKDFVIIGFPANNFMNQEPGTEEEIKDFCTLNYGVTFPMMSKISVKGDDMHPLYQWLTDKEKNGFEDSSVSWNFQKYLIDENGNLVKVLKPRTSPDDESIIAWLTN
jgi:glutathione peroxidase